MHFAVCNWELLDVSLCEEPLHRDARVHGFTTRDIRARMLARQRMADALAELRCDLPERDGDEYDLVSVRMPDPRLIFYGRRELLV